MVPLPGGVLVPRRRAQPAPTGAGGVLRFPDALVRRGLSGAAGIEQCRARAVWLREHGVDPGDWPAVYAVLLASPGYVSSLERARGRCEPL